MARRKNMERRRVILGNTFRLIRENGMSNVSLQMIAEKSNISKSLLQSYYPHKSQLISDIVRNLFTTLGTQVDHYAKIKQGSRYVRMKVFIYTIGVLGTHDKGLDRIISQVFNSSDTLQKWGTMLFAWLDKLHLFDDIKATKKELKCGITFITIGVGRLYYERKQYNLSAEDLSNYATSSLMFSFCHCNTKEIEKALDDGHDIIEFVDMKKVHQAINTMFDERKEIIS